MFREIFCRFVAGRDAGSEVPIEGNSSQIRRRTCLEYLFELSNILGEGPASGASPFVVEEDAGSAVFVRVSFLAGILHCHWQDRTHVGSGTSVSVRVDLVGRRIM